jgi:murein DD-endopeptidase MepM/ murein hydrolase activator NlpD
VAISPAVQAALLRYARASGDPRAFVATALVESGLNPAAVGDQGHSFGLYQLNDRGRLLASHLSPQQALDPETNARVSAAEFAQYARRGLRGSALALAAQRPSDPSYAAKISAAETSPLVRAILAQLPGSMGPVQRVPPAAGPNPLTLAAVGAQGARGEQGLAFSSALPQLRLARSQALAGHLDVAPLLAALMAPAQQQTLAPHAPQLPVPGGVSAPVYGHAGELVGVHGPVIGTPYSGTHTLGNWQSDNAIDVGVPLGTPVYAPFAGVIDPTHYGALGSSDPRMAGLRFNLVGPANSAYGAHLSRLVAPPGAHLAPGALIGYSGVANATPHLHFAVLHGDPRAYYR